MATASDREAAPSLMKIAERCCLTPLEVMLNCLAMSSFVRPHGLATPPYGIVTDFAGLKPHTGGRMCIANFYMRVQQPKITLKKGVPVTISFVARAAVQ